MNAKNKRGSSVLVVLTALAAAVLLVVMYLQFGALRTVKAELKAEEAQMEQTRLQLQNMKELEKQEAVMEANLEVLAQLLPDAAGDEKLLVDMQSASDLSGLSFALIRFGDGVKTEDYSVLPMDLVFEGRYHGLLNLFDFMRVYERAIRIDEVKIELSRAAPPNVVANIRASAFYTTE
jgi:type IV pilus assembly protein PilO